ncbi:MAG: ABC transporter ATP-binding protein [Angustibacter sp.]
MRVHGEVRRGGFVTQLDLDVAPGEVLALLGPNGAGKTTVLRAVAGLEALQYGRIAVGDRLLDDGAGLVVPAERRSVGLVSQEHRLFPHLSVADNVAFGPRASGAGRGPARAAARHWLDRLGLLDLAGHRPGQLSGGQAQRVALARVLATNPAVLLLDEPLSALDARARMQVRSTLSEHLADFPGPVVVVTHDPGEAVVLADRVAVLEQGRVVQSGHPVDVMRRPQTDYVARLAGATLLRGRPGPAPGTVLVPGGLVLSGTPVDKPPEAATGQLLAAIRPSAVTVCREEPESGDLTAWPARVAGIEPWQERVRVYLDGPPDVLADIEPAVVADLGLVVGQRVWACVAGSDVVVYPDTSG